MNTKDKTYDVQVEPSFTAAAEKVYDAWLEPALVQRLDEIEPKKADGFA